MGARTPNAVGLRVNCSFFDHALNRWPRDFTGNEHDLRAILGKAYAPSAGNPGGTPKKSMAAISGAYYPPGKPRGVEHALGVGVLLLDFDNTDEVPTGDFYTDPHTGELTNRPVRKKVCIENPIKPSAVLAALRKAGVSCIGWTTYSCTPQHPKFRFLIFLAEPVPVALWARYADAALTALGLDKFRRGLDLPVLHNPAALAFVPGSPAPETIKWFEVHGVPLTLPLASLPPLAAPTMPKWQADVVAARKSSGEQWWMAYETSDGRAVDFMHLDLGTILEANGIKVGPAREFKGGIKRRTHCPWATEHSHAEDDDSGVVIHTPGHWPTFKCAHSGHQHMGLRDLIEWAWGRP